jgi:hypothetical protein
LLGNPVRLFGRLSGGGGGRFGALRRSSSAIGSFDGSISSGGGLRNAIGGIDLRVISVT